jgi:hypothetical protein
MRRVLTLVVGLAVMTWAAQAALLTSPNGNTINPDDYISIPNSGNQFSVTVNGNTVDELYEDVLFVSVNGSGYVLVDSTNFQFEASNWADPFGPGTGWSEVSNTNTFGGTVNAGDIHVAVNWAITDMTGPEGGARYQKNVSVVNDSGADITASIINYVDLDILDSSATNNDVGCYFSAWGYGTMLQQNDPATTALADFRGYFYLAQYDAPEAWESADAWDLYDTDIVANGALTNAPADGSAWWNGGGIGPDDLAMAFQQDLGTIADGMNAGRSFSVAVPEPTTYALVGLGLAAIAAYRRRKS